MILRGFYTPRLQTGWGILAALIELTLQS